MAADELSEELLATLQERFEENMHRHEGMDWAEVRSRLEGSADKLRSLGEMERTGGEPDVVGRDEETGEYIFWDCAPESPKGRRSVCYDREALESRKKHKPETSAMDMAAEMGAVLLTEEQYRRLQELGPVDSEDVELAADAGVGYGSSGAPSSAITGSAGCSSTTTGPSRTTGPAGSGASSGSEGGLSHDELDLRGSGARSSWRWRCR